jgi:hypothetical protein
MERYLGNQKFLSCLDDSTFNQMLEPNWNDHPVKLAEIARSNHQTVQYIGRL